MLLSQVYFAQCAAAAFIFAAAAVADAVYSHHDTQRTMHC